MSTSGSPRVRLQPIYSDRSLEAIQMRYRENAGVINRRILGWHVASNAPAFDRLLLIGICFPNISYGLNSLPPPDTIRLLFVAFLFPNYAIYRSVYAKFINSQVNGLKIDLRFLDLETCFLFLMFSISETNVFASLFFNHVICRIWYAKFSNLVFNRLDFKRRLQRFLFFKS